MNTIKKGICLLLALLLCVGLFAACGNGTTDAPETTPDPDLSGDLIAGIDARTVMLDVAGMPVYWEEVFFDLHNVRAALESGGPIADWDAIIEGQTLFPGELTYNEFVLLHAVDAAVERRVVEQFFTVELGEELEENFYEEVRAFFLLHHGLDEAGFETFLEDHFLTENVFRYVNEVMTMHEMTLLALYGPGGATVSESAVNALVEEEGILRAQHILLSILDVNMQPIPADEQAAVTARALLLYQELMALSGDEQLERFLEMMFDYGEDPGMWGNPDGYTFLPGVMIDEFTAGTAALNYYEISEPILGFFGYHIILRLPVQREARAMMVGGAQSPPIQLLAARAQLERIMDSRMEEVEYEWTPALLAVVPSEIFAHSS